MASKEEIVRTEMQSLRQVGFKQVQGGVAVLTAVELALVPIRSRARDRATRATGAPGSVLLRRHLIGTALQVAVATGFAAPALVVSRRYRFYADQLRNDGEDNAMVPEGTKNVDALIAAMFFAFPALDLLLWPYERITARKL